MRDPLTAFAASLSEAAARSTTYSGIAEKSRSPDRLAEHQEAVRKSRWELQLPAVPAVQRHANPTPEVRQRAANIDRDIVDRTRHGAHQLALGLHHVDSIKLYRTWYSVPRRSVGETVRVQQHGERVTITYGAAIIADHHVAVGKRVRRRRDALWSRGMTPRAAAALVSPPDPATLDVMLTRLKLTAIRDQLDWT